MEQHWEGRDAVALWRGAEETLGESPAVPLEQERVSQRETVSWAAEAHSQAWRAGSEFLPEAVGGAASEGEGLPEAVSAPLQAEAP